MLSSKEVVLKIKNDPNNYTGTSLNWDSPGEDTESTSSAYLIV